MRTTVYVGIMVLSTAAAAYAQNKADTPDDKYAVGVRSTRWSWMPERASIMFSLLEASSPYDIRVLRPHDKRGVLSFQIMDGDREVYGWLGHAHSVFVLRGQRLYYASYSTESCGGVVVAVDLSVGKEIWRSPLNAVGNVPHFGYRNLINIAANDDAVSVFGNEGAGRYYELKDVKTGRTVGHKIFDTPKGEKQSI